MSIIEQDPYRASFSADAPGLGVAGSRTGTAAFLSAAPSAGAPADVITPFFGSAPQPQQATEPWQSLSTSNGLGPPSGLGNIIGGFLNQMQSLISQLAQRLGLASGGQAPTEDTFVRSAVASSVGDPHDAFDATTATGQTIADKWNNMQSHADLLNSDSFAGGYTVSTTTTPPKQNGVTMNSSASVALDGGATDITMNADGSFSISSYGRDVQLQEDQSTRLADGATVSLGAGGTLTVTDTNASGGTLSTRLASNGHGGVDVKATASNVDLGGYLVTRNGDGPAAATQNGGGNVVPPPPTVPFAPTAASLPTPGYEPVPSPAPAASPLTDLDDFATWQAPSEAGSTSFAPLDVD